eukprot:scaffold32674_cov29-Tisochrysis_lutea.AAC.3
MRLGTSDAAADMTVCTEGGPCLPNLIPVRRSRFCKSRRSRSECSRMATPARPARPVRPERWTYDSGSWGILQAAAGQTASVSWGRGATRWGAATKCRGRHTQRASPVLNDQVDALDVYASCRHICGHEHGEMAITELLERGLAQLLRDVTVERLRAKRRESGRDA